MSNNNFVSAAFKPAPILLITGTPASFADLSSISFGAILSATIAKAWDDSVRLGDKSNISQLISHGSHRS
jgi:hypothetical protein